MSAITFGEYLKQQRLEGSYGLREFARKIDMHPSNLSNLERGKIPPLRHRGSLEVVAEALGFGEEDARRKRLFDLAVADLPDRLPADLKDYATEVKVIPLLLRTIADKRLSEEQIRKLTQDINELY